MSFARPRATLETGAADRILYASVRHRSGACAALFYPDALGRGAIERSFGAMRFPFALTLQKGRRIQKLSCGGWRRCNRAFAIFGGQG